MGNEKAIEIIKAYKDQLTNSCSNLLDNDIEAFTLAIKAMEERPQGEWIADYTEKKHKKVFVCDKCRRLSIQGKTNFCPNCGAKMLKGGAEDEI